MEHELDRRYIDNMGWEGLAQFIESIPEPWMNGQRWLNALTYALILQEAGLDLI